MKKLLVLAVLAFTAGSAFAKCAPGYVCDAEYKRLDKIAGKANMKAVRACFMADHPACERLANKKVTYKGKKVKVEKIWQEMAAREYGQ